MEKLKVFISSARESEGSIIWADIRKELSDTLGNSDFISPYLIDDHSSDSDPQEVYLRQLDISDMVIFLISNEIRPGTSEEYKQAKNLHKPFLIYFDKNIQEFSDGGLLKEKLSTGDIRKRTTYKEVDFNSFNPKKVLDDLVASLVDKFQIVEELKHENSKYRNLGWAYQARTPKSLLKMFEPYAHKLRGVILNDEIIGKDKNFGDSCINWLLGGNAVPQWDVPEEILNKDNYLRKYDDIFKERRQAISEKKGSNFRLSLQYETEALNKAKKEKQFPIWILHDIEIDCRNLAYSINFNEGEKFQNEIDQIEDLIVYPVLDRVKSGVLDTLFDQMNMYKNQSNDTINFGSNLPKLLDQIEEYLYLAILYGSDTHTSKARELLADVLYQYSVQFEDDKLLFWSLKCYVLNGNVKQVENILKNDWSIIFRTVTKNLDELLDLCNSKYILNRDSIKLKVLRYIGGLLAEQQIVDATNFMYEIIRSSPKLMGDDFGILFVNLISKMDNGLIKLILKKINETSNPFVKLYLPVILQKVKNEYVKTDADIIAKDFEDISKVGGDLTLIADCIKKTEDPEFIKKIQQSINKYLKGNQREIFLYKLSPESAQLGDLISTTKQDVFKWIKGNRNKITHSPVDPSLSTFSFIIEQLNKEDSKNVASLSSDLLKITEKAMDNQNPEVVNRVLKMDAHFLLRVNKIGVSIPNKWKSILNMKFSSKQFAKSIFFYDTKSRTVYLSAIRSDLKNNGEFTSFLAELDNEYYDEDRVENLSLGLMLLTSRKIRLKIEMTSFEKNTLLQFLKSRNSNAVLNIVNCICDYLHQFSDKQFFRALINLKENPYIGIRYAVAKSINKISKNKNERKQIIDAFKNDPSFAVRDLITQLENKKR